MPDRPLTQDTSDADELARADLEMKAAREAEVDDLRSVLALPGGRRFLWRLLGLAGIYEAAVRGDGVEMAALRDGRRQLGLDLLIEINAADPAAIVTMQTERLAADRADRDRREAHAMRAEAEGAPDSDSLA